MYFRKPQGAYAPFLLKIFGNTSNIKLNENSFLSNFMVICDFYSDQKLIPIKSMSFGKFCTSNFKPVFVEHAAGADSAVSIPLKFITTFMFDYFKGKNLKTDLEDIDKVHISLMLYNLTPSAAQKKVTFLTNKVSFPKEELFLFIANAR